MRHHTGALAFALGLVLAGAALADPAPVLRDAKDADGKPLPFELTPYHTPDTPLGTGPYKAIMAEDPSLPDHTLYYPANMDAAGKLPVITWGNGACINAGNRFRIFLTEIASHGFLVVSGGPIANVKYEVGPQENPAVRPAGSPPPAPRPPAAAPAAPATPPKPGDAVGRNTAEQMIAALDWAQKANADPKSKFYGKLDTSKMGVGGQSCGGGLATTVAADPRIKAAALFSGAGGGPAPAGGAASSGNPRLDAFHAPTLIVAGDAEHDIAHQGSLTAAAYLTKVPVFLAWQDKLTHIGTYGMPNGGELGRIGWQWFAWQLRGDQNAAKTFKGADCGLCKSPDGWHITKKMID